MKSIQSIHKEVLSTFMEYPIYINDGNCDEFMMKFIKALEKAGYKTKEATTDWDWDMDCHYWTICKGKHYDSETPNGVNHPLELPFFIRNGTKELYNFPIKR